MSLCFHSKNNFTIGLLTRSTDSTSLSLIIFMIVTGLILIAILRKAVNTSHRSGYLSIQYMRPHWFWIQFQICCCQIKIFPAIQNVFSTEVAYDIITVIQIWSNFSEIHERDFSFPFKTRYIIQESITLTGHIFARNVVETVSNEYDFVKSKAFQ